MRVRAARLSLALLLAGFPLAAQPPTVEERLTRLEQQVRELRLRLGLDSAVAGPLVPTLPTALLGNDHVRWGYPGGSGTILPKPHFVILHDNAKKVPVWVTYHLSREALQGTEERSDDFRPDSALPAGQRAELADYRNSGYDRGHMAPAADFKRSAAAMSETFLLSNMAPQRPRLNREIWARLEDQVRTLARSHGSIWVFTGALYLDNAGLPSAPSAFIGPGRVAVPTHFYKAILCEHADGSREMFAFLMRNNLQALPGQPRDYAVSVARIQQLSGLDFFAELSDAEEARLEAIINSSWPVP